MAMYFGTYFRPEQFQQLFHDEEYNSLCGHMYGETSKPHASQPQRTARSKIHKALNTSLFDLFKFHSRLDDILSTRTNQIREHWSINIGLLKKAIDDDSKQSKKQTRTTKKTKKDLQMALAEYEDPKTDNMMVVQKQFLEHHIQTDGIIRLKTMIEKSYGRKTTLLSGAAKSKPLVDVCSQKDDDNSICELFQFCMGTLNDPVLSALVLSATETMNGLDGFWRSLFYMNTSKDVASKDITYASDKLGFIVTMVNEISNMKWTPAEIMKSAKKSFGTEFKWPTRERVSSLDVFRSKFNDVYNDCKGEKETLTIDGKTLKGDTMDFLVTNFLLRYGFAMLKMWVEYLSIMENEELLHGDDKIQASGFWSRMKDLSEPFITRNQFQEVRSFLEDQKDGTKLYIEIKDVMQNYVFLPFERKSFVMKFDDVYKKEYQCDLKLTPHCNEKTCEHNAAQTLLMGYLHRQLTDLTSASSIVNIFEEYLRKTVFASCKTDKSDTRDCQHPKMNLACRKFVFYANHDLLMRTYTRGLDDAQRICTTDGDVESDGGSTEFYTTKEIDNKIIAARTGKFPPKLKQILFEEAPERYSGRYEMILESVNEHIKLDFHKEISPYKTVNNARIDGPWNDKWETLARDGKTEEDTKKKSRKRSNRETTVSEDDSGVTTLPKQKPIQEGETMEGLEDDSGVTTLQKQTTITEEEKMRSEDESKKTDTRKIETEGEGSEDDSKVTTVSTKKRKSSPRRQTVKPPKKRITKINTTDDEVTDESEDESDESGDDAAPMKPMKTRLSIQPTTSNKIVATVNGIEHHVPVPKDAYYRRRSTHTRHMCAQMYVNNDLHEVIKFPTDTDDEINSFISGCQNFSDKINDIKGIDLKPVSHDFDGIYKSDGKVTTMVGTVLEFTSLIMDICEHEESRFAGDETSIQEQLVKEEDNDKPQDKNVEDIVRYLDLPDQTTPSIIGILWCAYCFLLYDHFLKYSIGDEDRLFEDVAVPFRTLVCDFIAGVGRKRNSEKTTGFDYFKKHSLPNWSIDAMRRSFQGAILAYISKYEVYYDIDLTIEERKLVYLGFLNYIIIRRRLVSNDDNLVDEIQESSIYCSIVAKIVGNNKTSSDKNVHNWTEDFDWLDKNLQPKLSEKSDEKDHYNNWRNYSDLFQGKERKPVLMILSPPYDPSVMDEGVVAELQKQFVVNVERNIESKQEENSASLETTSDVAKGSETLTDYYTKCSNLMYYQSGLNNTDITGPFQYNNCNGGLDEMTKKLTPQKKDIFHCYEQCMFFNTIKTYLKTLIDEEMIYDELST